MGVHSFEQDFADRNLAYFGKKHFGFLVKIAKQKGVGVCESVISEMREKDLPVEARIKYFTKMIHSYRKKYDETLKNELL